MANTSHVVALPHMLLPKLSTIFSKTIAVCLWRHCPTSSWSLFGFSENIHDAVWRPCPTCLAIWLVPEKIRCGGLAPKKSILSVRELCNKLGQSFHCRDDHHEACRRIGIESSLEHCSRTNWSLPGCGWRHCAMCDEFLDDKEDFVVDVQAAMERTWGVRSS